MGRASRANTLALAAKKGPSYQSVMVQVRGGSWKGSGRWRARGRGSYANIETRLQLLGKGILQERPAGRLRQEKREKEREGSEKPIKKKPSDRKRNRFKKSLRRELERAKKNIRGSAEGGGT